MESLLRFFSRQGIRFRFLLNLYSFYDMGPWMSRFCGVLGLEYVIYYCTFRENMLKLNTYVSFFVTEKGCDIDMEQDMEYRQNLIQGYKKEIEPLLRYLPWLKQNAGRAASNNYQKQGIGSSSISFPVYDSALMSFVKEASGSRLMNRNYPYVYTRNRIRSHDDERRLIAKAELRDWDVLCGILSRYVMGGRTKATLWSEAVQENIFLLVLERMRRITEFWDKSKKV